MSPDYYEELCTHCGGVGKVVDNDRDFSFVNCPRCAGTCVEPENLDEAHDDDKNKTAAKV